jgi:hypothetical protein
LAEPGAAAERSCAAPAWLQREAPLRGVPVAEREDEHCLNGLRWCRLRRRLARRNPSRQPRNRRQEDAPPQPERQAAADTEPVARLPASAPKSPSSHRRAWRCWKDQSWDDCPARFLRSPKALAANRAQNDREPSQPHALQWNSSESCPQPDP